MRRCPRGSEGIFHGFYAGRRTDARNAVSGHVGGTDPGRPCLPGDRCVCGQAGHGGAGVRACGGGGDRTSWLRSAGSVLERYSKLPPKQKRRSGLGTPLLIPRKFRNDLKAVPLTTRVQVGQRLTSISFKTCCTFG